MKRSRGGENKEAPALRTIQSTHHPYPLLLTVNMEVSWHPFLRTALLFLIMISINLVLWRCI